MNEVALCANDVLRNDVMLRINEVALRANGISPFAWHAEISLVFSRMYRYRIIVSRKMVLSCREDKLGDLFLVLSS